VKAPDWYILYAAQNLNVYLNTLHEFAGEAISLTQSQHLNLVAIVVFD
jgi:hypothetical protein